MKLRITQSGDAQRSLEVMGDSFDDLGPAIDAWLLYFKAKTQERFQAEGPGWPEKKGKDSARVFSEDLVKRTADSQLRRKLFNEYQRSSRRYMRGRGSVRAMDRRWAVLKEFERQAAGGVGALAASTDARLEKSVAGLRKRHERALGKARGKLLGRIAQSIRSKSKRYSAEVWSEVPWSGIHNEGGVAGHGAKVPKRQFLDIDDHDLEVLKNMIDEHTKLSGS